MYTYSYKYKRGKPKISIVSLTEAELDAILTACNAMLAGEPGEGDFLCQFAPLDKGSDKIAAALKELQEEINEYQNA